MRLELLLAVIIGIVGVLIVFGFIDFTTFEGASESRPVIELSSGYDYTPFIKGEGITDPYKYPYETDTEKEIFCNEIEDAIIKSVRRGNPQYIEIEYYGDVIERSFGYPLEHIYDCDWYGQETSLYYYLTSGVKQELCKLNLNTISSGMIDARFFADIDGLSYHDCTFTDPSKIDYDDSNYFKIYTAYDYFYSGSWNGPGKIKILIQAEKEENQCKVLSGYCFLPAFADDEYSMALKVFDGFRRLQISGLDSNNLPFNVRSEGNVFYHNSFTIDLDKSYDVKTIIQAIKYGLYENQRYNGFDWNSDHWEIDSDANILPSRSWGSFYDNELKDENKRTIEYNCNYGDTNTCEGKITFNAAFKIIEQDGKEKITSVITFYEEDLAQIW